MNNSQKVYCCILGVVIATLSLVSIGTGTVHLIRFIL